MQIIPNVQNSFVYIFCVIPYVVFKTSVLMRNEALSLKIFFLKNLWRRIRRKNMQKHHLPRDKISISRTWSSIYTAAFSSWNSISNCFQFLSFAALSWKIHYRNESEIKLNILDRWRSVLCSLRGGKWCL